MALVSCSPSPAPGSLGALDIDATVDAPSSVRCGGTALASAVSVADGVVRLVGAGSRLPVRASLVHRRSDSVVQPTISATFHRATPSTISWSARCCSSDVNRLLRAATAGAAGVVFPREALARRPRTDPLNLERRDMSASSAGLAGLVTPAPTPLRRPE